MASVGPRHVVAGAVAAALGTVAVHWLRELPWPLAAIVGVAIGVLAASSLRAVERLRSVWGGAPHPLPRRDDDGR